MFDIMCTSQCKHVNEHVNLRNNFTKIILTGFKYIIHIFRSCEYMDEDTVVGTDDDDKGES